MALNPSRGSGGAALVVVFVAFVPLAFSADFLQAAHEGIREDQAWWELLAFDLALLLIILLCGLRVRNRTEGGDEHTLRWWFLGAGLTLALDVGLINLLDSPRLVRDLGGSLLYVGSIAMLLAFALKISPLRMLPPAADHEAWKRFRPALPLLVGTLAAYVGSVIWTTELDRFAIRDCAEALEGGRHPAGAVDQEYFAQVSQVIPLLLVGLGIEAGFFRQLLRDPGPRAMTIVTVVILGVGEALALSALPEDNQGCNDILYGWHEYAAFILTLEACFVALSTLVMALVIAVPEEPGPAASA